MQTKIKQHLTGEAALIASAFVIVIGALGADIPAEAAAALVFIACAIVSALAPRWAEARGLLLDGHPAALTAAVATAFVWIASALGLAIDQEQAVVVVGGLAIIVSIGTPRAIE